MYTRARAGHAMEKMSHVLSRFGPFAAGPLAALRPGPMLA